MEFILKEDYVLAVCDGYRPVVIDYDIYNNMTEDERVEYVNDMLAYQDIASYMREFGDPDDWD